MEDSSQAHESLYIRGAGFSNWNQSAIFELKASKFLNARGVSFYEIASFNLAPRPSTNLSASLLPHLPRGASPERSMFVLF